MLVVQLHGPFITSVLGSALPLRLRAMCFTSTQLL